MRKMLLLLWLVLLTGCERKPPAGEAQIPEAYRYFMTAGTGAGNGSPDGVAKLPYESISLRRTPCYGSCPVYEVIFRRDGTALLNAQQHLPTVGKFAGTVHAGTYARLCYLIEKNRFENLETDYRGSWTDDSTCIVTVVRGGESTEVRDYGKVGPIELWAIQQAIEAVRLQTDWKPAE